MTRQIISWKAIPTMSFLLQTTQGQEPNPEIRMVLPGLPKSGSRGIRDGAGEGMDAGRMAASEAFPRGRILQRPGGRGSHWKK